MDKRITFCLIAVLLYCYSIAQTKYFERFDSQANFRMNWQRHDLDSNFRCGWQFTPYSPGIQYLDFFRDSTGILKFHYHGAGIPWLSNRADDFIVNKVPIRFNRNDSLVVWIGASGDINQFPNYTPDTVEIYVSLLDTSWIDRPLLLGDYRHLLPFSSIISYTGDPTYKRYSFPLLSLLVSGTTQDSSFILGFRKRTGYPQYSWIDNISIESPKRVNTTIVNQVALNCYPNPSTGNFNLQSDQKINRLTLVDCFGRTVFSMNQPNLENDFSFLPEGIYFYTVETNDQLISGKWIRN